MSELGSRGFIIHAATATAAAGCLASLPFNATALRPEHAPRGEPWRGTESDRATLPTKVERVSDPILAVDHPKGTAAPPVSMPIWPHSGNNVKRSLLGMLLSGGLAADEAGRRAAVGEADAPTRTR